MGNIKLLVTDMDNTLLNSEFKISGENISVIKRFIAEGRLFTVATGRSIHSIELYDELVELINAPAILYNGAIIYDLKKKKVVYQHPMVLGIEKVLHELVKQFPALGVSVFHDDDIYYINENDFLLGHSKREHYAPIFTTVDEIPKPFLKVLTAGKRELLSEVERFLISRADYFRVVYSEKHYLEILNKDVSKGSSLKMLAEMLCVPLERTLAVGDNLNDKELLETAGIGVAVANANVDLLHFADAVCCGNDEHAIAYCITNYSN